MKEDRKEGEREREVELGEEIYGRSTRTYEHKFPKKQFLSKTSAFSFTICFFYREERDREVAMKRRLRREKKSRRLCTGCVDSR